MGNIIGHAYNLNCDCGNCNRIRLEASEMQNRINLEERAEEERTKQQLENVEKLKAKQEQQANEQLHLNHPFYKRVKEVVDEVEREQIIYGAGKYPEPFNPMSWKPKELLWHNMKELRDAQVYSVGLFEQIEHMEKELENHKANSTLYGREQEKFRQLNTFLFENFNSYGDPGDHVVDVAIQILERKIVEEKEYDELVDKYEQLDKEYDGLVKDYAKQIDMYDSAKEELEEHRQALIDVCKTTANSMIIRDKEIEKLRAEIKRLREPKEYAADMLEEKGQVIDKKV